MAVVPLKELADALEGLPVLGKILPQVDFLRLGVLHGEEQPGGNDVMARIGEESRRLSVAKSKWSFNDAEMSRSVGCDFRATATWRSSLRYEFSVSSSSPMLDQLGRDGLLRDR